MIVFAGPLEEGREATPPQAEKDADALGRRKSLFSFDRHFPGMQAGRLQKADQVSCQLKPNLWVLPWISRLSTNQCSVLDSRASGGIFWTEECPFDWKGDRVCESKHVRTVSKFFGSRNFVNWVKIRMSTFKRMLGGKLLRRFNWLLGAPPKRTLNNFFQFCLRSSAWYFLP